MFSLTASITRSIASSVVTHSRKTVVYSNGYVVSWHPQESVPFEKTKAIEAAKKEEESVIAVNSPEALRRMRKGPTNQDLKEIFYTDRNEWFTKSREDRLRSVSGPRAKRH